MAEVSNQTYFSFMIIDDGGFDCAVALAEALQFLAGRHTLRHLFKLADCFAVGDHAHLERCSFELIGFDGAEHVGAYRLLPAETVIVGGSAASQEVLSSETVREQWRSLSIDHGGVFVLSYIHILLLCAG